MMGIEPTTSAWEAEVLPLNYIRTDNHFYQKKIYKIKSGEDLYAVKKKL